MIPIKQLSKPALFQPRLLVVAMALATAGPVLAAPQDEEIARFTVKEFLDDDPRQFAGFDITKLPDNEFAVVWAEYGTADSPGQIKLQRLSRSGDLEGAELTIYTHTETTKVPWRPVVEADADGNMVVAWGLVQRGVTSVDCLASNNEMMAKLVSMTDKIADLVIDMTETEKLCGIDVAVDADGDFALLWTAGTDFRSLVLKVLPYNKSGSAVRQDPLLPIDDSGVAFLPGHLAMQDDGSFLVTWSEAIAGGKARRDYAIYGQWYGPSGVPIGTNVRMDGQVESTLTSQLKPQLAAQGDQGYWVTWVELEDPSVVQQDSYLGAIRVTVEGTQWMADRSQGEHHQLSVYIPETSSASLTSSIPSLDVDSEGNLLSAWVINPAYKDGVSSISEATIVGGDGAAIDDSPFEFSQLEQYNFAHFDLYGSRVAMNDQAIAVLWSDRDTKKIDAVIYEGLVEPDPDPDPGAGPNPQLNSTSGGSLGWFSGLMVLTLGLRRRVRKGSLR